MANVATNGGTLNFVMTNPLNQPSKLPTIIAPSIAPKMVNPIKRSAEGNCIPFFNNPAVMAPHNANIEPTERSIPAVRTINVIPVAMQTFTATCRSTFIPFAAVKNLSVRKLNTIHNTTNAISD